MQRFVLIFAAMGILAVGAGLFLLRSRDPEPAVARAPTAPPPAPSREASSPPKAEPALPAERPVAKRAPTPAPATAPTPAPTVEAPPETGTLIITSDVPGAQVFLDREFIGATPVTARDIKPGPHQLNVSVPGFDNHVETIEVSPGSRELAVRFREVRLDASLDVVHKHRIGSCRGRLTATPQGVRYETTDKDDAFSAALGELETFQVDYLNKNLRIQVRKGRRYDFTDPEGNADRLFVFHRDVDRARERLKAMK